METKRSKLRWKSERPEGIAGRFGAGKEGSRGIWGEEGNRSGSINGVAVRMEKGASANEIVGEVVISNDVAGNRLGFEGKVEISSISARGDESVAVG